MSDFVTRVKLGAAVLNRNYPEWWEKINLDNLVMEDSTKCVLGQLFGRFSYGRLYLETKEGYTANIVLWAVDHGFNGDYAELRYLKPLWIREITNHE